MIRVGDPAPDFSLLDGSGRKISLSALKGRPVVLFFYPKDNTAICTKEACSFRDRNAEFRALGAEIFGISADHAASHQGFSKSLGLGYPLLSDPGGRTARRYGVRRLLGLLPGRATFVIDRNGIVRMSFSSAFQAEAHVLHALKALEDPG